MSAADRTLDVNTKKAAIRKIEVLICPLLSFQRLAEGRSTSAIIGYRPLPCAAALLPPWLAIGFAHHLWLFFGPSPSSISLTGSHRHLLTSSDSAYLFSRASEQGLLVRRLHLLLLLLV